jgi:hypothetical protein
MNGPEGNLLRIRHTEAMFSVGTTYVIFLSGTHISPSYSICSSRLGTYEPSQMYMLPCTCNLYTDIGDFLLDVAPLSACVFNHVVLVSHYSSGYVFAPYQLLHLSLTRRHNETQRLHEH